MNVGFKSILTLLFSMLVTTMGCATNQGVANISIIPEPARIQRQSGFFELSGSTRLLISEDLQNYPFLKQFSEKIRLATGISIPVMVLSEDTDPHGSIVFKLLDSEEFGEEGYRLEVQEERISVQASTAAGLYYGMQSLVQLFPVEIESTVPIPLEAWKVPSIRIKDNPRFIWRGMHLDVCRHFFPVSFIKKMLDQMARYKLNTFHWHLTEDQGWRIEIKQYPRLTEIGAWRKETLVGRGLNEPHWFDGERYGGFYTQDEIREIVEYAADRFITVVPEIEMPGHSTAALAAYPELSCTGGPFEVATHWGIFKDVYCAGKETTFRFLEDVLTEVADLFPGRYVHIGGDECPKDRWCDCPQCQARIESESLKDEDELQSYFIKRIEGILEGMGKRLIGWDEILEGGLAPGATVMSWRGMDGGIEAANEGHDVVMTPTSHCYFDYYQGKGSEPLAIGGYTPVKKVYSFEPIPKDIEINLQHHILGAQANVWTEFITTYRHVEYMVFPRLCALAEVVWSPARVKDFRDFTGRLDAHLRRFAVLDVNFRSP